MTKFKSDDELKECPFCGYEFPMYMGEKSDLSDFRVECPSCGIRSVHPDSIEKTVKAWNKRTKDSSNDKCNNEYTDGSTS